MGEQIAGQLAFDFDELARDEARDRLDEWAGAPLGFTQDYYSPQALDEAFAHWQFLNGNLGSYGRSHMWHRSIAHGFVEFGEHRSESYTVDLRPEPSAEGPGDLLYKMVCQPCGWQSEAGGENDAVEAWHDHAVPGWRDLPVIPHQVRVRSESGLTKVALKWIEQTYPEEMQLSGAPIITERQPYGTRHVPGYSPWGGYDLSHTALDRPPPSPRAVRALSRQLPDVSLDRVEPSSRRPGLSLGD